MKDPSRSSTSPSIINEDVIINGHSHEDDNPFAEYMWMENEEEFNRQIEEELWEEEFIERCFQEMLEEEEEHEWFIPARDLPQTMDQIQDQFNDLVINDGSSLEDLVVKLFFILLKLAHLSHKMGKPAIICLRRIIHSSPSEIVLLTMDTGAPPVSLMTWNDFRQHSGASFRLTDFLPLLLVLRTVLPYNMRMS